MGNCRTIERKEENKRLKERMYEQQKNLEKYAKEYYQMGNDCITQAHDSRAAIANYDKAIELYPKFTDACQNGDGLMIMEIVLFEMDKNNLHTKGSNKLRDDINRMLEGKTKVSTFKGTDILTFVWNSRLSGMGYAVTY